MGMNRLDIFDLLVSADAEAFRSSFNVDDVAARPGGEVYELQDGRAVISEPSLFTIGELYASVLGKYIFRKATSQVVLDTCPVYWDRVKKEATVIPGPDKFLLGLAVGDFSCDSPNVVVDLNASHGLQAD